jgi:outer membrane protein TolC
MRVLQLKYGLLALCTLLLLQSAGCVSSEQFYEEAYLSRTAAYERWKDARQTQEKTQTHISGELGMSDCLKLVLTNNKSLQHAVEEKEIARGERLISYSAILPSVGFAGDYTRLDKVSSIAGFTIGDVDNYSSSLKVTQPVFAGGSITAKLNAAKLFSLLTDQSIRAVTQDVLYAAQKAYLDVLLNQHLLEISADAVRSAQAHLDSVKQRQEGGVASGFDVLRAEVELSNFKAEHIQNKNAINVSKSNLLKIMGVSQDSNIVLSDELEYLPSDVSMDEAVESAFQRRPDLFKRQLDIKWQQEQLNIAKSRWWPRIDSYYENTWSNPDPHNSTEINWGRAWQAGITATLPVFDGFAREGAIIQQKARFKQAQIDLIDTEETALFELTKALLTIEDSQEFVESQLLNLARAKEGLRLAEVGYREGINTQVEMIDAQAALTKARAFYYQAIYSHMIARLDLQKAMGILDSQPQDDKAAKSNAEVQSTATADENGEKVVSQKIDSPEAEYVDDRTTGEQKWNTD